VGGRDREVGREREKEGDKSGGREKKTAGDLVDMDRAFRRGRSLTASLL